MAIDSAGYAGPITDAAWAQMGDALLGQGSRVVSGFTGTAVAAGTRQVSWSAGTAYAHGVLDTMAPAQTTDHAAVTSGSRWDTVVLRRDWAAAGSGRLDPVTGSELPGRTTLTVVTGSATEAVSAAVKNNPGVLHDQPIGLVQITAGQSVPTAVRSLKTEPRHDCRLYAQALTGTQVDRANIPEGEHWPDTVTFTVHVPLWATRVAMAATWAGVANDNLSNTNGVVWVRFGTIDTQSSRYWPVYLEQSTMTLHAASDTEIPPALRGTRVTVRPYATGPAGNTSLLMDSASSFSLLVDFREA